MRTLPVWGGQFTGGNQAPAEEALFVLTVKQNDFHRQVLVLPQQHADFRVPGAFVQTELLPVYTVLSQRI
jgi:hypothetical protein